MRGGGGLSLGFGSCENRPISSLCTGGVGSPFGEPIESLGCSKSLPLSASWTLVFVTDESPKNVCAASQPPRLTEQGFQVGKSGTKCRSHPSGILAFAFLVALWCLIGHTCSDFSSFLSRRVGAKQSKLITDCGKLNFSHALHQ